MKALTVRNNWLVNQDDHYEVKSAYRLDGKVATSLETLYKRPVHQWSGVLLQSENLAEYKGQKTEMERLISYLSESDKSYNLFGMSINTLVVNDCKMTYNGIDILVNYLSTNRCIKNFVLSNIKIIYEDEKIIINEKDSVFSSKNLSSLSEMIKSNKNMVSLDLTGNYIGDYGIKELASALAINTSINKINLSNNYIGDDGVEILAEKISKSVAALGLSHNEITDKGLAFLSTEFTNIQVCDLGHNQISDQGIAYLSFVIKQGGASNLKALWLDNNKIGDAGAYDLALSINQVNNREFKIKFLDVSRNIIEAEGINDLQTILDWSVKKQGFQLKMACQSYDEALEYTKVITKKQEVIREDSEMIASRVENYLKKSLDDKKILDCRIFMLNFDARNDVPEVKSLANTILQTSKSLIPICLKGWWTGMAVKVDASKVTIAYTDPAARNWSDSVEISKLISYILSNSFSSTIKNYKYLQEELSSNSGAIIIENLLKLACQIDKLDVLNLDNFKKIVPKPSSAEYVKQKHILNFSEANDFRLQKILHLALDNDIYKIKKEDIILQDVKDDLCLDNLKLQVRDVLNTGKTVVVVMKIDEVFQSSLIISTREKNSDDLQLIYHDVSGKSYRDFVGVKNLINELDIATATARIDLANITPQSYKSIKVDDLTALNVENLKIILSKISNFKTMNTFNILTTMKQSFDNFANTNNLSIEDISKNQKELLGEYITDNLDSHIFEG